MIKADRVHLRLFQNKILGLTIGAWFGSPIQKLQNVLGIGPLQTRQKLHKFSMNYKIYKPLPQIQEHITTLLPTLQGQTTGISLRNMINLFITQNLTDHHHFFNDFHHTEDKEGRESVQVRNNRETIQYRTSS